MTLASKSVILLLNFEDMEVCSHIVTLETKAYRGFIIYSAICSSVWDSWPIIPCKMQFTYDIQFRLPFYLQKLFYELCESVTLPCISYIFHFVSTNTILSIMISFSQKSILYFCFTKKIACNIFLMCLPFLSWHNSLSYFLQ